MRRKKTKVLLGLVCLYIIFLIGGCQRQTTFQQVLVEAESICFIGDSVTAGSNNEGHPWYEPLLGRTDAEIINHSWGGATTYTLLDNIDTIAQTQAEYYVVAIGTNDIRFRNEENSAMTAEEYIMNLETIVEAVTKVNSSVKFVFITPWYSVESDPISVLSYQDKMNMNQVYSDVLKEWCLENEYLYIDPQPYIIERINQEDASYYLLDYIHPNKLEGIEMYAEAVFAYDMRE